MGKTKLAYSYPEDACRYDLLKSGKLVTGFLLCVYMRVCIYIK